MKNKEFHNIINSILNRLNKDQFLSKNYRTILNTQQKNNHPKGINQVE